VAHRTQGNTFTSLLKPTIKDADEQLDEEMHRVKPGRVLSTGASVPMKWGTSTYQCMRVHPPGSSVSP